MRRRTKSNSSKWDRERAEKYFHASGNVMAVSRPFELVLMDGTELKQVTLFSKDVQIPSQKLKVIGLMDAYSLFAFPSSPFGGSYRTEMSFGAIMGALTPPALTEEMIADNPMLLLCFGRIGHLRADNDKALILQYRSHLTAAPAATIAHDSDHSSSKVQWATTRP